MKERSLSTSVINEREIERRTREEPKLFGPREYKGCIVCPVPIALKRLYDPESTILPTMRIVHRIPHMLYYNITNYFLNK